MNVLKKENFIIWLKFFACLLITNSHCRDIYPLFFLAVGGGHGNAIFFAVSGYCLAYIHQNFSAWYFRRLRRVFPQVLMVLCIAILFVDGFSCLIDFGLTKSIIHYLDLYWFIPAIFLYYFFFYFLFKPQNEKHILCVLVLYIVVYLILYLFCLDKTHFVVEMEGFSPFKVYFYFGIFLFGGYLRLLQDKIREKCKNRLPFWAILSFVGGVCSILLWCATYSVIMLLQKGYAVQFLIHLSIFSFIFFLFTLCILFKDRMILPSGRLGGFISLIAASTLEVYLVQVTLKPFVFFFDFPANMVLFFLIAFGGGVLLHLFFEKMVFWRKKHI